MQLRGEAEFVPPASLAGLTSLAHSAYAAFGLEPPHGAPIVGPGAFGTWAGMHGSSERKNPGAYLWTDPALRRREPGHRRQRAVGPRQHHAALGVARRAAQLRAGADADGHERGHDRGRRLHGQRSFLPPGLHAHAGNSARLVHRQELAHHRRVRRRRRPLRPGIYDAHARRTRRSPPRAPKAPVPWTRSPRPCAASSTSRIPLWPICTSEPSPSPHSMSRRTIRPRTCASPSASIADGHEPWVTAGVSSDLNQAALMAIVDGFHYWLLMQPGESNRATGLTAAHHLH